MSSFEETYKKMIYSNDKFNNITYKASDLHLVNYWVEQKNNESNNRWRTILYYDYGIDVFNKIEELKIVPLHLKYYKILLNHDKIVENIVTYYNV